MKKLLLCLLLAGCATKPMPEMVGRQQTVLVENTGGHGSGAVVNENCVVTAAHVTEGIPLAILTTADRKVHMGKVVAEDIKIDVAVVCAEESLGMPKVVFAKEMPQTYDPVFIVGFPLMWQWIMTTGTYQGDGMITAQAAPGNSGGPAFDSEGRYIGLVQFIGAFRTALFAHLCGIVEVKDIRAVLDRANIKYEVEQ